MLLSDSFNRRLTYLRVSVTDRCNLRCIYCMPEEGVVPMLHSQVLTYEELVNVVQVAVEMGVRKVRITGGEPLVRKGITGFIRMLSGIAGIEDLSMTTNGILLKEFAAPLADAGLHRINVSLDSMDPAEYHAMTRGGDLQKVIQGIFAAKDAGLMPIKLNCVVRVGDSDTGRVSSVRKFGEANGFEVRLIQWMDLEHGQFSTVEGGEGGNCNICNRLRTTSDGYVVPCLFSDIKFSIRTLGAKQALIQAAQNKPACGSTNPGGSFYNIGG